MGAFTSLPVEELLQSDTPAELLRRLEQTPYAEIAGRARHLLEQGEALFALDAALDRRYFAGLARRSRSTDSGPGHRARHHRLHDRPGEPVWLLRYRFAYNLSPAQAYYLLIPASHRLLPQQMQQLAQCATFEDAMSSLSNPFDKISGRRAQHDRSDAENGEGKLAYRREHTASQQLQRRPRFAYMMLRERDLRRMRAIACGRSMRMGGDEIRSALGIAEAGREVS